MKQLNVQAAAAKKNSSQQFFQQQNIKSATDNFLCLLKSIKVMWHGMKKKIFFAVFSSRKQINIHHMRMHVLKNHSTAKKITVILLFCVCFFAMYIKRLTNILCCVLFDEL